MVMRKVAILLLVLLPVSLVAGVVLVESTPSGESPRASAPVDQVPAPTEAAQPAVDPARCDVPCVIAEAERITATQGPATALAWVSSIKDDGTQYTCHAIHHAIGVLVGEKSSPDFPPYLTSDCQYGYLHGTLQGVATQISLTNSKSNQGGSVDKINSWLSRGLSYCNSLRNSAPGSPSNVRNSVSECLHALGHGASVIEPQDLVGVMKTCSNFAEIMFTCADGAMMEYADDIWNRAGWVHWETGYTEVETQFDPSTVETLCSSVSLRVAEACWHRIGSFVGPLFDGDPVKTGSVCLTAPTSEYRYACLYNAAVIAVENFNRSNNLQWPPRGFSCFPSMGTRRRRGV
jgi:hypothetical protein